MNDDLLSMDQLRATYSDWHLLTDPATGLHVGFREVGTQRHVVCDYSVAGLAAKLEKAGAASDDQ